MMPRLGKYPGSLVEKGPKKSKVADGTEAREVIPFYMNNSYQTFRYDPRYDTMPAKKNKDKQMQTKSIQPSKPEKKRKSKDIKFVNAASNHRKEKASITDAKSHPELTLPSVFTKQTDSQQPSINLDESIQQWYMKSESINSLPNIKNPNSTKTVPIVMEKDVKLYSHGSWTQLHLYNKIFNSTRMHPKHDPVKENILKHCVVSRLKRGSTVTQLAKEPFFEDVLDICEESEFCPAYKKGRELSLDQWRSLRNCKYLRVSDTNLISLKEATLHSLGEEQSTNL